MTKDRYIRRRGRRAAAFSMVELVMIMVLLSILGAVAAPRYSRFVANQRLDAAVRRVSLDLQTAQRLARVTGTKHRITFSQVGQSYQIDPMACMDRPDRPYRVNLAAEPYGVTLTLSGFSKGTDIVYDGYGAAAKGGTLVLSNGAHFRTITITADASIAKPEDDVIVQDPIVAE